MNCLDGGWPTEALEYVNNTGLASDTNYEYLSYMNECSGKRIKRAVKITDYCERKMEREKCDKICKLQKITLHSFSFPTLHLSHAVDCKGNEEYLQYLVANYGPVSENYDDNI